MRGFIAEFEELVLLTIAYLDKEAYGVAIKQEIERRANRPISIGSLHSTLTRLEEKKFLASKLGEPSNERGGRRKRFFTLTLSGKEALTNIKSLRDNLWSDANLIPITSNGN